MRWALAATALLLAAAGALVIAGDGDGEPAPAPHATQLTWKGEPQLIAVPELPADRILTGRIRNASLRAVDLNADRIEIVGADGKPLRSTARFLQNFAHGLYPWSMNVKGSKFERTRIGEIATVKPGQDLPLTLSWRLPPGGAEPVEVRFGGGSLALPR